MVEGKNKYLKICFPENGDIVAEMENITFSDLAYVACKLAVMVADPKADKDGFITVVKTIG